MYTYLDLSRGDAVSCSVRSETPIPAGAFHAIGDLAAAIDAVAGLLFVPPTNAELDEEFAAEDAEVDATIEELADARFADEPAEDEPGLVG